MRGCIIDLGNVNSNISTRFGRGSMESRQGNWQEFEVWLQELRDRNYRRGLFFRGQTNSEWRLETTLERSGRLTMSIADYYALIVGQIGPTVSAFSTMQAPL